MSGGYFEYSQYRIQYIIESLEEYMVKGDQSDPAWEKGEEPSEEVLDEFRKGLKILKQAFVYTHRIDKLLSGDTGNKSFLQYLNEDLKELECADKKLTETSI
jgi:hypothetical protein